MFSGKQVKHLKKLVVDIYENIYIYIVVVVVVVDTWQVSIN